MNKKFAFIMASVAVGLSLAAVGCGGQEHVHSMEHISATQATCTAAGNSEYYYCDGVRQVLFRRGRSE